MNPQFPVPLNENKLNESDVKEMPAWFKTPLDYINKIAETLFYAQEVNLEKEILSKIPSSDFEGYLDSLGGSDGDMLSKISGGYDFTPPLDVESYLNSLGGSDGQALVKNSGDYGFANVGKILQVASATKTDVFATTSTSFVDITGLSVTITPKFATSKILVLTDLGHIVSSDASAFAMLVRDSTQIYKGDTSAGVLQQIYNGASSTGEHYYSSFHHTSTCVDDPNTTDTITYKIQVKTNTGTVYINRNIYDSSIYDGRTASSIIAMEIGA